MKKMKLILLTMAVCLIISSCEDKRTATRILEENGYTEIELTGYRMFCCSKDDTYSTGFKAKSPAGKIVTGCVCSSTFTKGATIRFE